MNMNTHALTVHDNTFLPVKYMHIIIYELAHMHTVTLLNLFGKYLVRKNQGSKLNIYSQR